MYLYTPGELSFDNELVGQVHIVPEQDFQRRRRTTIDVHMRKEFHVVGFTVKIEIYRAPPVTRSKNFFHGLEAMLTVKIMNLAGSEAEYRVFLGRLRQYVFSRALHRPPCTILPDQGT